MTSVGKICRYCSRPIAIDDRVACCDRCFAAHHEDCWERNGRCSTFRCAGLPRTMRGDDLPAVMRSAMERANELPTDCPFCGNKVFLGILTGKRAAHGSDRPAGEGLLFQGRDSPAEQKTGLGKRLLGKVLRGKSWWLPGAQIKARSCGKCKRLFLWGVAIDEAFIQQSNSDKSERFCPHCSTALNTGQIALKSNHEEGARFVCEDAPDFHKDWIGHNLLDRYVYNRWNLALKSLPAHSCPECQYSEIAGRPIYRFL